MKPKRLVKDLELHNMHDYSQVDISEILHQNSPKIHDEEANLTENNSDEWKNDQFDSPITPEMIIADNV